MSRDSIPTHSGLTWRQRVQDPRRQHAIRTRTKVELSIRRFFGERDFLETPTPLLVPCPGMEPHIRPFSVSRFGSGECLGFLPTSPEFAMKRLLVGGLEKIFQICPAFRDEPVSPIHRREFTMLEWYRAGKGYDSIMQDTQDLFEFIAIELFGKPEISYQGKTISVRTPWPRLRVRDLFQDYCGIDLGQNLETTDLQKQVKRLGLETPSSGLNETWDDLYFKIWLNCIEPRLPQNEAVFVHRYPASQAALAVVDQDPDGTSWAKRFEFYIGGIELGNAFEELTDPVEQRKRFEKDMDLRELIYGNNFPRTPFDEGFLDALAQGMPPSGGIAVGVDRMVMLFADEPEIDYTFWI